MVREHKGRGKGRKLDLLTDSIVEGGKTGQDFLIERGRQD
jgi:hypothetical protein